MEHPSKDQSSPLPGERDTSPDQRVRMKVPKWARYPMAVAAIAATERFAQHFTPNMLPEAAAASALPNPTGKDQEQLHMEQALSAEARALRALNDPDRNLVLDGAVIFPKGTKIYKAPQARRSQIATTVKGNLLSQRPRLYQDKKVLWAALSNGHTDAKSTVWIKINGSRAKTYRFKNDSDKQLVHYANIDTNGRLSLSDDGQAIDSNRIATRQDIKNDLPQLLRKKGLIRINTGLKIPRNLPPRTVTPLTPPIPGGEAPLPPVVVRPDLPVGPSNPGSFPVVPPQTGPRPPENPPPVEPGPTGPPTLEQLPGAELRVSAEHKRLLRLGAVQLYRDGQPWCSGVLVRLPNGETVALSASHCIAADLNGLTYSPTGVYPASELPTPKNVISDLTHSYSIGRPGNNTGAVVASQVSIKSGIDLVAFGFSDSNSISTVGSAIPLSQVRLGSSSLVPGQEVHLIAQPQAAGYSQREQTSRIVGRRNLVTYNNGVNRPMVYIADFVQTPETDAWNFGGSGGGGISTDKEGRPVLVLSNSVVGRTRYGNGYLNPYDSPAFYAEIRDQFPDIDTSDTNVFYGASDVTRPDIEQLAAAK